MTLGCSVKSGALFTKPPSFTTLATLFKSPFTAFFSCASNEIAHCLAASYPSSTFRSAPNTPLMKPFSFCDTWPDIKISLSVFT